MLSRVKITTHNSTPSTNDLSMGKTTEITNSSGQLPEIFWGSGSPFAWRVLMTAELKSVPFESQQLQFSEKEHKAPAYLAINERGEVPSLRDGNFVLTESLAIMTYLDAEYPDPPLFGRSSPATGLIWRWISVFVYHFEPLADRIIAPVFGGVLDAFEDDIQVAAANLHSELSRIEESVEGNLWLGGDSVSAADIIGHSDLEFLLRIVGRDEVKRLRLGYDDMEYRYPSITAWRDRMTRIEGYDKAYPPHWRTS